MLTVIYKETLGWAVFGPVRVSGYFRTEAEAEAYLRYLVRQYDAREKQWRDRMTLWGAKEERARVFIRRLSRRRGVRRFRGATYFNRQLMNSMIMKENRRK